MLVVPNLLDNDDDIEKHGQRYTKHIASFDGGNRIGFGFKFESTCREWNCTENCGPAENRAMRRCRHSDFKRHQDVILRNRKVVDAATDELGHVNLAFFFRNLADPLGIRLLRGFPLRLYPLFYVLRLHQLGDRRLL